MNVQKAEMRLLLAQEMGKKFEAREEATKAELYRYEGSVGALRQAKDKLDSIKVYYNKDRDEDKITTEHLEVAIRAVDRCAGLLDNLMELAKAQTLVKQGELAAHKANLDLLEKMFNDERSKIEGAAAALERGELGVADIAPDAAGNPTIRIVDGRPPNGAAADLAARRAAAKAAKEAKGESEAQEPPSESPEGSQAPQEPILEPVASDGDGEASPMAMEPKRRRRRKQA